MGDCSKGKYIWHWCDSGARTEPLQDAKCDCYRLTFREFKPYREFKENRGRVDYENKRFDT